MKKLFFPLAILAALLMAACTLVDEDLRAQHDVPGVASPVHVETDYFEADYQYTEQTTVITPEIERYIALMDTASLTLYFYDYTPDDLLPQQGRVLAAESSDKLPFGLGHRVLSVQKGEAMYELALEPVSLKEIFSTLTFNSAIPLTLDTTRTDAITEEVKKALRASRALNLRHWEEKRAPRLTRLTRADDDNDDDALIEDEDPEETEESDPYAWTLSAPFEKEFEFDSGYKKGELMHGVTISGGIKGSYKIDGNVFLILHSYVNLDDDALDIWLQAGIEHNHTFKLTGDVTLTIDILKVFGDLDKKLTVDTRVGPPGLNLKLTVKPSFEFKATLGGEVGFTLKKRASVTVGGSYGMPDKDNGGHFDSEYGKTTFLVDPGEGLGKVGWSAGLTLGVDVSLLVNGVSGIYFNPSIGASIGSNFLDADVKAYDRCVEFKIPIGLKGGLKTKILGFEVDIDLLKSVGLYFGRDNEEMWVLSRKKWYYYPRIKTHKFVRKGYVDDHPQMTMNFTIDGPGLAGNTQNAPYPRVYIVPMGGNAVDNKLCESGKLGSIKKSGVTSYSYEIPPENIDRGSLYEAIVYMKEPSINTSSGNTLATVRLPFSSRNMFATYTGAKVYYKKRRMEGITEQIWWHYFEFYVDIFVSNDNREMLEWGVILEDYARDGARMKTFAVKDAQHLKTGTYRLYFRVETTAWSHNVTVEPYCVAKEDEEYISGQTKKIGLQWKQDEGKSFNSITRPSNAINFTDDIYEPDREAFEDW